MKRVHKAVIEAAEAYCQSGGNFGSGRLHNAVAEMRAYRAARQIEQCGARGFAVGPGCIRRAGHEGGHGYSDGSGEQDLTDLTEEPPVGSLMRDRNGDIWMRGAGYWRRSSGRGHSWNTLLFEVAPLTLLPTDE